MFVIVQVGASQVRVAEGDLIQVDQLKGKAGETVDFNKVLMLSDGTDVRIGQPFLPKVKVTAKIVQQVTGEKVVAYKFRRRKHSATKHGHRKKYTALTITKISA